MEQIEGAMGVVFNPVLPIAGVFLPAVTPEESKYEKRYFSCSLENASGYLKIKDSFSIY